MFLAQSSKDVVDDMAFDVGETTFDAVVVEGQLFVVQSEEVKEGRVEVGRRDHVFATAKRKTGRISADVNRSIGPFIEC